MDQGPGTVRLGACTRLSGVLQTTAITDYVARTCGQPETPGQVPMGANATFRLSKNGTGAEKCRSAIMAAKPSTSIRDQSGFTLIDLLFTASLICTLATMSLPSLLRARDVAQSASALATLRVVNSAQLSFAVTCASGFYSPDFQTLGRIPPGGVAAFLPPGLSSGATFLKQGYSFTLSGTSLAGAPATCNGVAAGSTAPGYVATADPLDAVANPHFYGTNADGTIYLNGSTLAGLMPESGPSPVGAPIK
jgi:type II secretory pathway pseudopilin PulG